MASKMVILEDRLPVMVLPSLLNECVLLDPYASKITSG